MVWLVWRLYCDPDTQAVGDGFLIECVLFRSRWSTPLGVSGSFGHFQVQTIHFSFHNAIPRVLEVHPSLLDDNQKMVDLLLFRRAGPVKTTRTIIDSY